MEKLNEIFQKIQSTIQVVADGLISLFFQPVYFIIAIIQSIIDVWSDDDEEEETQDEEPQQQVTVYPSVNEGKYAEECELPVAHKIGYRINEAEQEELEKIKKELNQ